MGLEERLTAMYGPIKEYIAPPIDYSDPTQIQDCFDHILSTLTEYAATRMRTLVVDHSKESGYTYIRGKGRACTTYERAFFGTTDKLIAGTVEYFIESFYKNAPYISIELHFKSGKESDAEEYSELCMLIDQFRDYGKPEPKPRRRKARRRQRR